MSELVLEPILMDGGMSIDDRGSVSFVNGFGFEGIKRFYMVENRENHFIRAWHGHQKETKFVYVVHGTALVGTKYMYDENISVKKFILSAVKPQILYIPPGYYNGFMSLEPNTKIMFYSTSTLDESLKDDIRQFWDKWNIWNVKDYR